MGRGTQPNCVPVRKSELLAGGETLQEMLLGENPEGLVSGEIIQKVAATGHPQIVFRNTNK